MAATVAHLALGAWSYNADVRYYFVEIASVYLCVFAVILQFTNLNWQKWLGRTAMISTWLVLVMSQLGAYGIALNSMGYFIRYQHAFGRMGADSPWRSEEAGLDAFDQIAKKLDPAKHASLLVYPVKRPDGFPRFMEPFTLKLIALSKGYSVDAAFPHPVLFEDWKTWHSREGDQFDYYFVGPVDPENSTLIDEIHQGGDADISLFSISAPKFQSPLTFYLITARRPPPKGPILPSPTLWLRADGHVLTDKDGRVTQWTDEGSSGITFYKIPDDRFGATLIHAGALSRPALHFVDDKDRLAGPGTSGDILFDSDKVSLFVVLRQDGRQQNNELFTWGNCQESRFVAYLGLGDGFMFQMGDPHLGQYTSRKPPGWNDQFHILSFVRDKSALRLSTDGAPIIVESLIKPPPLARNRQVFPVGIAGLCGEGFKGDISEIILFKEGLDLKLERQVQHYLSKKYGIPLSPQK